jgi:hypothetical protein
MTSFLAAGLLLPTLALGSQALFQDDFDAAVSGELPTIPPWSEMTSNDVAFGNYILVRQDSNDLFGKGSENQYMEFHGTDLSRLIAASFPEADAEVVTFSFDFIEPDGNKTDPLIIFLYGADGAARAERLRLTHGGLGATAPAAGSRVYALDTVNRLDWVMNNSSLPVAYRNGRNTVEPGKSDIWINGALVLANYSFEAFNPGPIRGMDIRTFGGTPNQHVLFDDLRIIAGAEVRPVAVPAPLMEFKFLGNLENTGTLGGEGSFIHPREETHGYVWQNRPSFGVGLGGHPNTGLDNTQVGGMGDYGQPAGETDAVREGGFFFPGTGLRGLHSVTIAGWYKTEEGTPWASEAFMVGWPRGLDYRHQSGATATRLRLNVPHTVAGVVVDRDQFSGPTPTGQTPWQQVTSKWVFHAATFDGTTGTMSFYYGYEDSDGVRHDVTRTDMGEGPMRNLTFHVAFGNSFFGIRPFKGHLDNIRIFGSATDGSGALNRGQLEAIWEADLAAAGGPPAGPEVRIVDFSHDGVGFSVSFETDAGASYVVESSSDLVTWNTIHTVQGDGSVKSYSDPVAGVDRRFYRVRVQN